MTYDLKRRGDQTSALVITQGDYSAVEDGENRYKHSLEGDDAVLNGIRKLAEAEAGKRREKLD